MYTVLTAVNKTKSALETGRVSYGCSGVEFQDEARS